MLPGPSIPRCMWSRQAKPLTKIAHRYGKSVAEIAKANNILPTGKVSIGDRLVIPGARISSAKPEAEPAAAPTKPTGNKGRCRRGPGAEAPAW